MLPILREGDKAPSKKAICESNSDVLHGCTTWNAQNRSGYEFKKTWPNNSGLLTGRSINCFVSNPADSARSDTTSTAEGEEQL